jgi:hypothetical protein
MHGYIARKGTGHAAGAGGDVLPVGLAAGALRNFTGNIRPNTFVRNAAGAVSQSHRLWVMEPLPAAGSGTQGVSLELQARTLKFYALVFIRLHFLLLEYTASGGIPHALVNTKNAPPPPPGGGGGGSGAAGGGGGGGREMINTHE